MTEQANTTRHKELTARKKISFSLLALGLFLMALELLARAAVAFLCVPARVHLLGETSYIALDPDLGWTLAPGVSHHVVRYPQGFDIVIHVGNGFRKDDQSIRDVRECDIITIGDSHTFGFGLKDDETLAYQLHTLLSTNGHRCLVFNGGVPGFEPCQYFLRLRALGGLARGSLVIVYLNPINDLCGLSRSIDYGSAKPYARLDGGQVKYLSPVLYDAKTHFHFAPDFDSLNSVFTHAAPAAPPMALPLLEHSRTWQLLHGLRQRRLRVRGSHIEPSEDVGPYRDGSEQERSNLEFAKKACTQFMASQWPEILECEPERDVAEDILFRIFSDMKRLVTRYEATLLIVVAQEAYGSQGHFLRMREVLAEQFPQYTLRDGQARAVVQRAAQRADVSYLMVDYPTDRVESMFIPYDGHTSAEGFSFVARRIVQWIANQRFAFVGDKRPMDAAVEEEPDINRLDGNGYASLHYAIQNGSSQQVERLIAEGADINREDRWGETPFYIAASRGHESILKILVDRGASTDVAGERGRRLFHQAVQSGQKDVTEFLMARGASVNAKNEQGRSALHVAALQGNREIVQSLLTHGADVSAADNNGVTPLHLAVIMSHKGVVETLLAHGADIGMKDRQGQTPLDLAERRGQKEIIDLLLKGPGKGRAEEGEEEVSTLK